MMAFVALGVILYLVVSGLQNCRNREKNKKIIVEDTEIQNVEYEVREKEEAQYKKANADDLMEDERALSHGDRYGGHSIDNTAR